MRSNGREIPLKSAQKRGKTAKFPIYRNLRGLYGL